MFTKCSFDKAENKLDYYRGRDCIEKLYKKLKKHAMKIINYEKKRNHRIYRIHEKIKFYNKQEVWYICKKKFCTDEHDEIKFYNKQEVSHICKKKFCTDEHDENYENKKSLRIIVIARENLEELLIANAI